jgi:hypothetical protein
MSDEPESKSSIEPAGASNVPAKARSRRVSSKVPPAAKAAPAVKPAVVAKAAAAAKATALRNTVPAAEAARRPRLAAPSEASPGSGSLVAIAPSVIKEAGVQAGRIEATSVTINQGGAGEVEAGSISVHQGGIGAASAEDITVSMGGIGRAQADDIAVRMGAVGIARGDRVSTELGSIGLAVAREVSVTQGYARTVLARDVRISQGGAGSVVAANVTFEKQSGTFVLVARRVNGQVRTVLDWRGALAFGAAVGIAVGLLARRKRD